jgi:hypothetical protein
MRGRFTMKRSSPVGATATAFVFFLNQHREGAFARRGARAIMNRIIKKD